MEREEYPVEVQEALDQAEQILKKADSDRMMLEHKIDKLTVEKEDLIEKVFNQEVMGIVYKKGVFNTLTWYEGRHTDINSIKKTLIKIFWHFYLFKSNHPYKLELKSSQVIFSPEITRLFGRCFEGVCKFE